jgi:beta-galactosidase
MSTKALFRPPFYGAAYYPEDWPFEQIDEDVNLMRKAGMNVMRVGEFAWSRMEPQEGRYDFDWLHRVVEKLADVGIGTIIGTPTATPPAWLTSKYPEVLFVNPDGAAVGHGGRRHICPNSPTYRELCARITLELAAQFGHDERVIAWQIDNEVAPHYDFSPWPGFFTRSCCCPVCRKGFQNFMQERYGDIQALNEAWCLHLWSMDYDSFEQLPNPDPRVWHHPSLLQAWDEFSSRSFVDFVKVQADILHEHAVQPVGTDMMPLHEVDHYAMNKHLDVVQFNHYDFGEGLRNAACWFDFLRPIKERPFWNTETSTSWAGNVATSGYSQPGFCRANSWMPVALGAEANLFWLWRTHWAGQELLFGSVLSSEGRPMHVFEEVATVADGLDRAADFILSSRPVRTGLALHFGHSPYVLMKNQPMIHGLNYTQEFQQRVYHPLIRAQFRPDVIDLSVDLAPYKVLISCFVPSLDQRGLRSRLKEWIEAGGIWIAGPFTDTRTFDGAKFRHAPFGSLEEWGGVYAKYQVPAHPKGIKVRWDDCTEMESSLWQCGFEPRGADVLAWYLENELAGLAAVTRHKMGKGHVVALGTMPPADQLVGLVRRIAGEAGIPPVVSATSNLLYVPRAGAAGEGAILVEMENRPAFCALPRPATDLLTGQDLSGTVEVPPYGVSVLLYT